MRRVPLLFLFLLALVRWQTTDPRLDEPRLKTMLSGLGYEVKEANASTFDVAITSGGLNKTKVWLSAALLQKDAVDRLTREDLRAILEKNVDVGPCHFNIENGWLKLKIALDNRSLTPAVLRTELDCLTARVGDSKAVWQKG